MVGLTHVFFYQTSLRSRFSIAFRNTASLVSELLELPPSFWIGLRTKSPSNENLDILNDYCLQII